jgi:putative aldouronate transport system permease protein
MATKYSRGDLTFHIVNYIILAITALLCILPFIHVVALSFSSGGAADRAAVSLWPVEPTFNSYRYAFQKKEFLVAYWNTIKRVLVGVTVAMSLNVLTAYPLSKTKAAFPGRTVIAWYFVVTMLVSGGMIPTYLIVSWTGLRNTIWALIVPGVSAFNVTLLLNFFRQIPKDLEESAYLDGAGPWRIMAMIYVPLSTAALATLTIFNTVWHWNEWFQGLIYMDNIKNYPLQTYLQGIIIQPDFDMLDVHQIELMMSISRRTFNAAQIMIATVPIILVYPFMQRYFVKGLTVGSLKG